LRERTCREKKAEKSREDNQRWALGNDLAFVKLVAVGFSGNALPGNNILQVTGENGGVWVPLVGVLGDRLVYDGFEVA
jgi:hypothetical protein